MVAGEDQQGLVIAQALDQLQQPRPNQVSTMVTSPA